MNKKIPGKLYNTLPKQTFYQNEKSLSYDHVFFVQYCIPKALHNVWKRKVQQIWIELDCFFTSNYIQIGRRQWHPTPVLLPGKSHGWKSLVGCSSWGRTELDTTEATWQHIQINNVYLNNNFDSLQVLGRECIIIAIFTEKEQRGQRYLRDMPQATYRIVGSPET